MEPKFWHERWRDNEIGFHQAETHALLKEYWSALNLAPSARVLVPLAGKSQDMTWLRQQDHSVTGVELSPLAIAQFFAEAGLEPESAPQGLFTASTADKITLLAGDIFDLTVADVADVTAVYDRAALIALPPEMRERYARHLAAILRPGTQILLIALHYTPGDSDGPPFSVSLEVVQRLFNASFSVAPLQSRDRLSASETLRRRGVTRVDETAYNLTRLP